MVGAGIAACIGCGSDGNLTFHNAGHHPSAGNRLFIGFARNHGSGSFIGNLLGDAFGVAFFAALGHAHGGADLLANRARNALVGGAAHGFGNLRADLLADRHGAAFGDPIGAPTLHATGSGAWGAWFAAMIREQPPV